MATNESFRLRRSQSTGRFEPEEEYTDEAEASTTEAVVGIVLFSPIALILLVLWFELLKVGIDMAKISLGL